ncbi:UPF0193 protein EVG1 [Lamellibrachia satsuma]|nr:UPF0193 protein EVG1 [Lamellibrachia satsuma]
MWNTPKATYSKDTQQLLKTMMQESKLTNFQQRQLDRAMQGGNALPTRVHPTSSEMAAPPPVAIAPSKIIDPRTYSSHTRHKDDIKATGAYERDQFHPKPLTKYRGFYDKEKDRLSNIMAYGEDVPPIDAEKAFMRGLPREEPIIDRFDELVQELEERKQFLKDMEAIGQGKQYRVIIQTEISQLIREMEVLDKKRTTELERRMKKETDQSEKRDSKEQEDAKTTAHVSFDEK